MDMSDLQTVRKRNLKALIKQWEGPTNLAKKLQYSGPSYLSQMIGPNKPITEKTARFIERTLDLPPQWLDQDHTTPNGSVDSSLVSRILLALDAATSDAGFKPSAGLMAELVAFIYDDAVVKNRVDAEFVRQVIKLVKGAR